MPTDWKRQDRRRFPRLSTQVPVVYGPGTTEDWTNLSHKALTSNISPLGISLFTAAPIQPGIILRLSLKFPEYKEGVEGLGQTVWCHPDEKHAGYCVGVEFIGYMEGKANFFIQKVAEVFIQSYDEELLERRV